MERDDIIDIFAEFLKENYYQEILSSADQDKKSIIIDFSLLDKFSPELADLVLENPEETLPLLEESFKQLDLPGGLSLKVRFVNLPKEREIRIRNIRAQHLGKLLCVEGIVKRASEVRPEVSEAIFLCPDCGKRISVIQTERVIRPPTECDCGCKKGFKFVDQKLYDARWIAIEEPFEIVSGERPSEIMVFLKEDLTSPKMQSKTDPGNRIKIVGILKELPRRVKGTRSRQVEIYIEANSIESVEVEWEELEITPEDEKRILELAKDPDIYNKFIRSIGPSLYGLEEVKEAIVLQLFGGEPHVQKDKSRVRGDIHILLVGDPSCLVGDERVVLGNGAIVKISSLGKEHLQKINVPVYLAEGYKCGTARVFHKYEFQPIIEIVTESGKSIKGTFNQPVLVKKKLGKFGKFKSEWKRLDEIKIGDEVRVINWIPCRIYKYVETGWDLKSSTKRKKIKVPKVLDEKLASILGYLLADGYVRKYRVGCTFNYEELDLLPKMKKLFEEIFGIKPKFYYHKEKNGTNVEMVFNSIELAEILQFLKNKRVPDMILSSKNSVVAAFLSWLYDGDGSVISGGRGKNGILYKAKDIELLRDIQILLLRFGIHSRIYGNNLMIRQANSIIKFANSIGFNSRKKKEKLQKLVENVGKLKRKRHNKRWERIVKIIYHPPESVYDIEVPIHHKFVANGIVCHNTAKSALMKVVSSLIPRGKYVSGKGITAAGLCTVYDTLVQLEDGRLIPIGKLVEEELRRGFKRIKDGFVANGSDKKVLSFSQEDLKIKPLRITKYWKLKAPKKLVKLVTQTGKEIIVTPENPIPVIKDGKICWKPACKLSAGDYVATPRICPVNQKKSSLIKLLDENAWIINKGEIVEKLIELIKSKTSIKDFCKEVGINEKDLYYNWKHKGAPTLKEIREITNKLGINIEKILPKYLVLSKWHGHKINIPLFMNSNLAYLMGLVAGDGSISKTDFKGLTIKFFNIHNDLLKSFKNICEKELGIIPFFSKDQNKVPYFSFNSKIFGELLSEYGVVNGNKSHNLKVTEELSILPKNVLAAYLQGIFDTDGSVIERKTKGSNYVELSSSSKEFIKALQMLLLRYGIISLVKEKKPKTSIIRGHTVNSGKRYSLIISGLENLKVFKKTIGFRQKDKAEKLDRIIKKCSKKHSNIDTIPEIGNLLKEARNKLGLSVEEFYGYKNYSYEKNLKKPTRKFLRRLISKFGRIENLIKFAQSDIFWDKIKKVKIIENKKYEYVYDITVEDEHSFVANGFIIHNTATVVRDEEFLGGWVLEAGALVMCNGSLCAIDEFEKVDKADQIALHEALEQQTISIAKASIVATLPARTSILAGGNPKFGRFDPYLPIKEQIDIPETLLARFDLKFALRDIPNPELDSKIAEHILKARHYGEEEVKPEIEPEFIKKYVAYARKNCHPKLTREAGEVIKDFFVKLREKVSGEEAPIPITLRQYEALIRLAEASAKVQLRNEVTVEDAMRAINLMKASLRQFGFDPETGKIDIDRAEGHIPSSQRGKIRIMLDIIEELTQTFGKSIPVDEIIRRAKESGVDNPENILRSMKSEGIVFEPSPGFIQKI